MDVNKVPETKASRAFRLLFEKRCEERGIAKQKRLALLAALMGRTLTPPEPLTVAGDAQILEVFLGRPATAVPRDEPRAPIGWMEGYLEMGRESVLSVLAARGLRPSPAEIRQITAIINPGLLFQLLQSAAIATTKSEALAPLRRPAGMRADFGSRSVARSRGRRAASTDKKADSHVR